MSLVKSMKNMPFKETINGATMNGPMIQELAKKLVEALNKNSWVLFSDTYTMMEKTLCDSAFDSLITPLQRIDYRSIIAKRRDVLKGFSEQCVLEAERERAGEWIDDVIDGKQKAEEKERQAEEQRRQKEEEERRQREIEAERRREEERQRQRMEQERRNREAAERKRREEEERARRAEESRRQAQRNLEEIERAKRKAKKKKNNVVKVLGVIAGVAAIFSDERLKQNITTIPDSEYEKIGLRGVTWVWNEKTQTLGMRGEEQGVIAQEVEKVYPQAVIMGSDGYKRVYYSFLDNLLVDKKQPKVKGKCRL
ncbi:protein MNN4-like [Actinia tenebrosa]|uniref:Protein MNN4-like n=1 Tax=Actinia tenebrosa TaxID=6105 RepID=A0A6P8J508_ACTTE|nr:protein MNN4-like [Actinia tenebrosa]